MVQLLLQAGADPRAADENGKQPLEMSREAERTDVEDILASALAGGRYPYVNYPKDSDESHMDK